MRIILSAIFFLVCILTPAFAQTREKTAAQPRLVIGIVVDQMRYDYLYRFRDQYTAGGFNRLLREGFSCENTHYNYMPTYTAPGHASIYTGTTPAVHGIIGNDWWDRDMGKVRYVTSDDRYKTVGSANETGKHSPSVLLASTITDEVRLSNAMQSKVIGICLKDRGSILPAGHIPNACYWFDDASGNWITSTYYPDSTGLPEWVQAFNARKLPDAYLAEDWKLLLPESAYTASFPDWNRFEQQLAKGHNGNFPQPMAALRKVGGLGMLRYTPFGNSFTLDFALTAIESMQLGADEYPDFLCLSFSSTDYIGHQFGIHSQELQDCYLRLDRDIERLLTYIDEKFGKDQVLIFLSADHGGAETPAHMQSLGIPAGMIDEDKVTEEMNAYLQNTLSKKGIFISSISNNQVYFDAAALRDAKLDINKVSAAAAEFLRTVPGVYQAYTREQLYNASSDLPFISDLRRGFHPRRGGEIFFQIDPAWFPDTFFAKGGTTHGSPHAYDTHVPLLWHGWRIPAGSTVAPVSITDITPTLAALLRIMEPNGNTGQVIRELFEKD